MSKRKEATVPVKQAIALVEKFYDELIEKLSQDKEKVMLKFELFGLEENSADLHQIINSGRAMELSSKLVYEASNELKKDKDYSINF